MLQSYEEPREESNYFEILSLFETQSNPIEVSVAENCEPNQRERIELICHKKEDNKNNIVSFIVVEAKEIHKFTKSYKEKKTEYSSESFSVSRDIPRMHNNIVIKMVQIEDIDEDNQYDQDDQETKILIDQYFFFDHNNNIQLLYPLYKKRLE